MTYLLEGRWDCALTELTLHPQTKQRAERLYLCSDLVQDSMSSSLCSLLSSYEFQHFSIVFLQLFSAEVFQDVAERTVSISLSNEMNAVDSAGIAVFR
jgi:hypothetical protein